MPRFGLLFRQATLRAVFTAVFVERVRHQHLSSQAKVVLDGQAVIIRAREAGIEMRLFARWAAPLRAADEASLIIVCVDRGFATYA